MGPFHQPHAELGIVRQDGFDAHQDAVMQGAQAVGHPHGARAADGQRDAGGG
jgi:hypothetical protein